MCTHYPNRLRSEPSYVLQIDAQQEGGGHAGAEVDESREVSENKAGVALQQFDIEDRTLRSPFPPPKHSKGHDARRHGHEAKKIRGPGDTVHDQRQ